MKALRKWRCVFETSQKKVFVRQVSAQGGQGAVAKAQKRVREETGFAGHLILTRLEEIARHQ